MFIERRAEWHERRDDLAALARLVERFEHDLRRNAALAFASAAAPTTTMGLDRADVSDALARHGPAAHPHRHREAGGRSHGDAVALGDQIITRPPALIGQQSLFER